MSGPTLDVGNHEVTITRTPQTAGSLVCEGELVIDGKPFHPSEYVRKNDFREISTFRVVELSQPVHVESYSLFDGSVAWWIIAVLAVKRLCCWVNATIERGKRIR